VRSERAVGGVEEGNVKRDGAPTDSGGAGESGLQPRGKARERVKGQGVLLLWVVVRRWRRRALDEDKDDRTAPSRIRNGSGFVADKGKVVVLDTRRMIRACGIINGEVHKRIG
jgi:hypothetical protein